CLTHSTSTAQIHCVILPIFSIYIICFLFVLLPPTSSTLFPYTTLFRSPSDPSLVDAWEKFEKFRTFLETEDVDPDTILTATVFTDRKSTRLNSSHVKSSYAVFCLKKKNKIKNQRTKHIKNDVQVRRALL